MSHTSNPSDVSRPLSLAIALVLALYAAAALLGWPQEATRRIVEQAAAEQPHAGPELKVAGTRRVPSAVSAPGDERHTACACYVPPPPLYMLVPFAVLLLAIAVLPLIPRTTAWWGSNLHRFYVAGGLGLLTLLYYLFLHQAPVMAHWPVQALVRPGPRPDFAVGRAVLLNAMLGEYLPFIIMLFSLYTISGGIRIAGDLRARPSTNTAFLLAGGLLASLIGTTGAAMLLIRPLLETNRERKHVRHTVVFFIFIVCNCGGCLLPLGDPPLYLGYLQGVPFSWTLGLWPEWLLVNGSLLAVYFLWDHLIALPRESPGDISRDRARVHPLRFSGIWPEGLLLAGIIAAVALLDPAKLVPGTTWHPWVYLREAVELTLVLLSLVLGAPSIRRANRFNYAPMVEVAALFFGIFLCMQPPLAIVGTLGPRLGLHAPAQFFWTSGLLSSVLDNAPTYLVYFEAARSLGGGTPLGGTGVDAARLAALSLGSVFMGAMTYIGNGPNFMVKAIAEQAGVRMPGFFGYLAYSLAILIPLFLLVTLLFFR
jgi:Na+/H+ antiporter NhaD/arsenite permease-like protein